MTPEEHYVEAERLVTSAAEYAGQRVGVRVASFMALTSLAQVHATLATVPPGVARLAGDLASEADEHAAVDDERPFREQTAGEAGLTGGTRSDGDAARWTPGESSS